MNLPVLPPSGSSSGLSPHRIGAVFSCPRKWYMRYIKRIRLAREPKYRKLGTLCHAAISWYWAGRMGTPPTWYTRIIAVFGTPTEGLRAVLNHEGAGFPDEIRTALAVHRYYADTHADQGWDPVSVEGEIKATLGQLRRNYAGKYAAVDPQPFDDVVVTCRTDLIARSNGALVLVDAKTVGRSWNGGDRIPQWKDDGEYGLHQQMMIDRHLVAFRYEPPKAVVIERVKRVAPFDHDANPIPIPALAYGEVLNTIAEAARIEADLLTRITSGEKVPAHYGPACFGRYGPCDYWNFCRANTQEARRAVFESDFVVGDEPAPNEDTYGGE